LNAVSNKIKGTQKPGGRSRRAKRQDFTWTVKPPACGDVKHGTGYGKQDPPAIAAVEFRESARVVSGEEQRRCVRAGHPRVARFKLCGGRARNGGGGEDDTLEKVKDVE
jgi:hypothetical protein